jgi:hypothetical protein
MVRIINWGTVYNQALNGVGVSGEMVNQSVAEMERSIIT